MSPITNPALLYQAEADYFAMHLLVPDQFLEREDLSKIDMADDVPIKLLAQKYGVSITLMSIRVYEFKRSRHAAGKDK